MKKAEPGSVDASRANGTDPAFALEDVTRRYGADGPTNKAFCALRDVHVQIPAGCLTTIVGPSGSGKSTLLSVLGLLDRPTSGIVTVAGHRAETASEARRSELRSVYLGFVFQAFHLMTHRSVLDNVMLGGLYRGMSHPARLREAQERIERVGLRAKSSNLAGTLSAGERQRVAVARALVGRPAILLCDEPTGNLDSANSREVATLLTDLASQGMTVVIVTHDLAIARRGDARLEVNDGRVSGDGVT